MSPTALQRNDHVRPAARPIRAGPVPARPANPPPQPTAPPSIETLAASWLSALAAAQRAVHAAAATRNVTALGSAQRLHHLQAEREQVTALLRPLARGHEGAEHLVRCLGSRVSDLHLLGLPDGVTACIFDVEGVLTTSAAAHRDAWRRTLDAFLLARAARLGREFVPFDPTLEYADHLAGRPRVDGLRSFLISRGISIPEGEPSDRADAESVHGLANRKQELLRRYLVEHGTEAYAGSRAYLEVARIVGAPTAVISASTSTGLVLEEAGIAQLVDERIDGQTMEVEQLEPKPAPDVFVAACLRLGVEPEHTAAFETTAAGIEAARAAGVRAVIAVSREESAAELKASDPDLVIRDLGELLARAGSRAAHA
jgi:HAD superfamily hydrolase (TIGR01509 family)